MADIKSAWVQVPNGALQIDTYLAEPITEEIVPGVIVIQEIFGVNAHIQDVTERLAREGYRAIRETIPTGIAPAIFQRTAPGFEVGYTMDETILGRKHKDLTTADQLLSDIQATINYLKAMPTVKKTGFGAIGFCFGGHVAYLAATLADIQATASFYGAGIATLTPGGGNPTITRTADIQGTLYAFFGEQDPLIPNEQTEQIAAALQAHNISHQVFCYEAGHGFFCDRRPDYDAQAASESWNQVRQLFKHL